MCHRSLLFALALFAFFAISTAAFADAPPTGQMPHPIAADQFDAQHAAAIAENPTGVMVDLETVDGKSSYQPGEKIELKISVTGPDTGYKLVHDDLERIEAFDQDAIYYEQTDAAVDPAPDFYYRYGVVGAYDGPSPPVSPLSPKPIVFTGALNEWLRFSKPGQYRIYLVTNRVSSWDGKNPGPFGLDVHMGVDQAAFSVASNVLAVTVAPPDSQWEASTISAASAALAAGKDDFWNGAPDGVAAETLRYIGTPAAVKILVDHMGTLGLWDEWNSWVFLNSERALYEAQDRAAAYAEMERCIADPQFPVRPGFLRAAARLKSLIDEPPGAGPSSGDNDDDADYQALVAETATFVESKTDSARESTLYTLLNEAENHRSSPKLAVAAAAASDAGRYAFEMVKRFDLLPNEELTSLLDRDTDTWPDLSKQNLGPNFVRLAESPAMDSDVRSRAVQCLWVVSPARARAEILADMVRSQPLLDLKTLESLPDKTLPGIDVKIAARLSRDGGYYENATTTGLLARYGTRAVLSQMKTYVGDRWDGWGSDMGSSLLAYFLRVDPPYGQSAFARCLASRANKECYPRLFTDVGGIYACDALQSMALHSLSDPNSDVTADAANYLRMYGTANSESALIAALSAYNKRPAAVQPASTGYDYDAAGAALVQAITASPSAPLLTSMMIQAIAPLCVTDSEKDELTNALNSQPDYPAIWIDPTACRIAQYSGITSDQVERIAAQYPAGTKISIYSEGYVDGFAAKAEAMRRYLVAHMMTVTVTKQ